MPGDTDQYGYLPNLPAGILGVTFFGLAAAISIIQLIVAQYNHKWMLVISVASFGEAVGWGGRIWAHFTVRFPFAK